MKLLAGAMILVLVIGAGMAALAAKSRTMQPRIGLAHGRLAPCPSTPNCVCSESGTDPDHFIEPLRNANWSRFLTTVQTAGGRIQAQNGHYLHATFASPLFGFVDDLEARLEGVAIHVRSASRVGHSDFGANRRRIERIRAQLNATFSSTPPHSRR